VNQPRYDVFLSYNRADELTARELARRLKDKGIEPWLDKWNLKAGDDWQKELEAALDACEAYAILIGPSGLGPWQNEEMRFAINQRVTKNRRVIPVFLPGGQREQQGKLPEFLISNQWVDFRRSLDNDKAFHELVCGITGRPTPFIDPISSGLVDICPYPGLKAYEPEDARFFFGRKAITDELLERLRPSPITKDEYRFLAIIGASGSGKSSLARAGLIPALKRGALDGSEDWPVVICRPGDNPLESLALALAGEHIDAGKPLDIGETITRFRDEHRTLHWITNQALHDASGNKRICLLVDQFEELFTHCQDESLRSAFIKNLRYAATVSLGKTVVVLTMRVDFYGKCAAYPALAATMADSQVLVSPMTEDELRLAIETPAQMVGCEFESGLVELLLQDAGTGEGILPLLQHTLRELWEQRTGRRLKVEAYSAMGKLEGALNQYANEIYDALGESEKEACKQLFLSLTQPGMGTEDTKRRAWIKELGRTEATDNLIQKLENARLIVTEGEEGAEGKVYVEVAHEALINGWSKLREWIEANRDMIRIKHRLTEAAIRWDEEGRQADYLYQGAPLFEAEEHFSNQDNKLFNLQQAFLDASIAQRDKLKREKEAQQREKEAQQRQKLRILAGFSLFSLCLAVVALYSYIQAESSERKSVCQLAQNYWINGVTERDRNDDPIKASHFFMQAAERWLACGEPVRSRNARFASNFLVRNVRLRKLSEEQGGSVGAVLDQDRQRVISWNDDGVVRAWDSVSGKWTMLLPQDGGIRYLVPSHDQKKILILGDAGKVRLMDVDSKQWREINNQGAAIVDATFSADDSRLLTWGDGPALRVWDTLTGQAIAPPLEHLGPVWEAGFSPDELGVSAWSRDGNGRVWTLPDGVLRKTVTIDGALWRVLFSPDKRRVLTLTKGGTVQVWDSSSLTLLATLASQSTRLSDAVFSPDGEQILVWSSGGRIWYWDYLNAQPAELVYEPRKPVRAVVFTHDGKRVLVWGDGGWSWILDLDGETTVSLQHAGKIRDGIFSNDDERLLTWNNDGTARLWHSRSGQLLATIPRHEGKIRQAVFDNDEQRILTWSDSGTARVWDIESAGTVVLPMVHKSRVKQAVFIDDDQRILTLSIDGELRYWDSNTGQAVGPGRDLGKFHGVRLSRNGKRILAWTDTTTLILDSQNTAHKISLENEVGIRDALFTRDGKRVITWSSDNGARVWDSGSGEEVAKLEQIGSVLGAIFSQDDRRLFIWDLKGNAQVLDATTWRPVAENLELDEPVTAAVFSHDGNRILICSAGAVLKWNYSKEQPVQFENPGSCDGAAFSVDDRLVVLWNNQAARVMDVKDNNWETPWLKHGGKVRGAVFGKDNSWLMTWSKDGTARLWGWDAAGRQALSLPLKHGGPVNGGTISQNQRRIMTWSDDGTVRLWNISADIGSPAGLVLPHQIRLGSVLDSEKELQPLSAREWQSRIRQLEETR